MNNVLKLVISVALPLAVGFTASQFTIPEIDGWFTSIRKPDWNPPNTIFQPVWTTLYILMGIALFLVWKSTADQQLKRPAFVFFGIQLVLNFFWSIIFFNLHQPGWAVVEIAFLWLFILLSIFAFAKINRLAAWLLVPYISWVSFAAILNFTIWQLNKG